MSVFILIFYLSFPIQINAEEVLDVYINDFYSKSNEASQILKDIESTLKEGSRREVCSRQRKAARLGLLANKSLIKAYEIDGVQPPFEALNASQKKWESILNEC